MFRYFRSPIAGVVRLIRTGIKYYALLRMIAVSTWYTLSAIICTNVILLLVLSRQIRNGIKCDAQSIW